MRLEKILFLSTTFSVSAMRGTWLSSWNLILSKEAADWKFWTSLDQTLLTNLRHYDQGGSMF